MGWKEIIEKVPVGKRWEMTAKSLSGACVGYSLVLLGIVGKEKWDEIESKMWGEGAKTSVLQVRKPLNYLWKMLWTLSTFLR